MKQTKIFFSLGAAWFLFSHAAHAGDKALAEELFRKGQGALSKPNATPAELEQACRWLKESLDQDATQNTQVVLATCYEKIGKNRSAWGLYTDAAAGTGPAAQYAKEHADALYKLGFLKLKIQVKDLPEDAKVSLDGENVGRGVLDTDINADPGEHTIRVRAEGKKDVDKKIELSKMNSPLTVSIALEDAPKPPPGGGNNPPPVIIQQQEHWSTVRTVGFVTLGVGVLGAVASGVMGILTLVFNANAQNIRNNPVRCPIMSRCPDADQERNRALGAQTAAIVTVIPSALAIIGGTVMFFAGGNVKEVPKTGVRFVPEFGGGSIVGTF